MKYKGLIFDLDGTLVNTDLYIVLNYAQLFLKYSPQNIPSLKEMVYFSGPPLTDVFAKYLPNYDPKMLKEEFINWALVNQKPYLRLYDDELEVLNNFKNLGLKLGIVTNKGKLAVDDTLKQFDLTKYFDDIYYLEKCKKTKPDPWPLVHLAEDLHLSSNEVLYIGDDKSDIIAGKGANFDTCLVKFGLKEGLEVYKPTFTVNSYKELERIVKDGKN